MRIRDRKLWIQIPAAAAVAIIVLECVAAVNVYYEYNNSYRQRRSMKAATLVSNLLPGNPFITPPDYPVHPQLEENARKLSRMGFLRPSLIESRVLEDFQAPQSAAAPKDTDQWGAFENMQRMSGNNYTASGWARAPGAARPADFILLGIRDTEGRHVVVAPGRTGLPRQDIAIRFGDVDLIPCGWHIPVEVPNVAPGTKIIITAWILDADTGQAYKLAGEVTLEL
jgi:hypothetical protein